VAADISNCNGGVVCASHSLLQTNVPRNVATPTPVEDHDRPAAFPARKSKAQAQQRQQKRTPRQPTGSAVLPRQYMQKPHAKVVKQREVVRSAILQKVAMQKKKATLPSHVLEEDVGNEMDHIKKVFAGTVQVEKDQATSEGDDNAHQSKARSSFDGNGIKDTNVEKHSKQVETGENRKGQKFRTEDEDRFDANDEEWEEEPADSQEQRDEEEEDAQGEEEESTEGVPSRLKPADEDGTSVMTAERMSKRPTESKRPGNHGRVVGEEDGVATEGEMVIKASKKAKSPAKAAKHTNGRVHVDTKVKKLAAVEEDVEVRDTAHSQDDDHDDKHNSGSPCRRKHGCPGA